MQIRSILMQLLVKAERKPERVMISLFLLFSAVLTSNSVNTPRYLLSGLAASIFKVSIKVWEEWESWKELMIIGAQSLRL